MAYKTRFSATCNYCGEGSSYSFNTKKEMDQFLEKEFGWFVEDVKEIHICPKCILKGFKRAISADVNSKIHNTKPTKLLPLKQKKK